MHTLTDISFALDAEALRSELHVEPDTADAHALADLVRRARDTARPKAAFRELFIQAKHARTVQVDGVVLRSRALARQLASAQRMFAFVATCGREVLDAAPADGDPLLGYAWEAIKAQLLTAARCALRDRLHAAYRLEKTATMSPGAGDADVWPIQEQGPLFALLGGAARAVGVELTDSYLMVPNKSVSGVRFPTELDFHSCQVCCREGCPSRSAPFDPALWRTLHED